MKVKKVICVVSILILLIPFILVIINYNSLSKIRTENKFSKKNGLQLMSGLASTFEAWGDDVDISKGYSISKECFDRLDLYHSTKLLDNLIEASKNNLFLDRKVINMGQHRVLYINQGIFLKDVKILYLTYNTLFPRGNEIYQISLVDDVGNTIATTPSLIDISSSPMLTNYENFFWGVDLDLYEKAILNISVVSPEGKLLSEYKEELAF